MDEQNTDTQGWMEGGQEKVVENRLVLRRNWKTAREFLMFWGREFQSMGAALDKALSPKLQRLGLAMEGPRGVVGGEEVCEV